jgi:hypothetical protein
VHAEAGIKVIASESSALVFEPPDRRPWV